MIVAMGPKGEIGYENKLLWHLPEDLKNFKKLTTGKIIVMGRKTFESIGRPLPNRTNVVVSRDINFRPEGVLVIDDPLLALDIGLNAPSDTSEGASELMVIGGGEIYRQFLPFAQRIYLSKIKKDPGPCDTYFPDLIESDWEVIEEKDFGDFVFKILQKLS